jgi:hypothetical protein
MLRSKWSRGFVFGVCFAVLSSTAAFAESGGTKAAVAQQQVAGQEIGQEKGLEKGQEEQASPASSQAQPEEGVMTLMAEAAGSAAAGETQAAVPAEDGALEKEAVAPTMQPLMATDGMSSGAEEPASDLEGNTDAQEEPVYHILSTPNGIADSEIMTVAGTSNEAAAAKAASSSSTTVTAIAAVAVLLAVATILVKQRRTAKS